MDARTSLVATTVVVNLALWSSYAMLKVGRRDFGATPKHLRMYLLVAALVAYAANLAFVGLLCAKDDVPASSIWVATACVAVYYALQLGFVPLVRSSARGRTAKNWVRALLIACVVPMTVLAGIGVESGSAVVAALGIVAVAHVLINDAVLFGFLF